MQKKKSKSKFFNQLVSLDNYIHSKDVLKTLTQQKLSSGPIMQWYSGGLLTALEFLNKTPSPYVTLTPHTAHFLPIS